MNILLSADQLGNSLCGGDPDETISSRLARIRDKYSGQIPWKRPVARLTADALERIDHGHLDSALEADRGQLGIFDQPIPPAPGIWPCPRCTAQNWAEARYLCKRDAYCATEHKPLPTLHFTKRDDDAAYER
jgi:hypothetical protein